MNLNLHYRHGGNRHALYKFLLVMKLIIILLTTAIMQVSATTYAQKITLNKSNAPLGQIIKEIRNQSGYYFFYNNQLLKQSKPITINVKDASIEEVLAICFKSQPLIYEVSDKTVMIKAKGKSLFENIVTRFQAVDIRGKVTDSTGTTLPGATLKLKNEGRTYITQNDGTFNFTAQTGEEITVSFIGYDPYVFTVSENMAYQAIVLRQASSKLEEVAVVSTGYQTIPKERATGSFVGVGNELLNRRVSTDIISRLEGSVPGLLFNRNTLATNQQTNISIRGNSTIFANNQPLIVVDGFPYNGDLTNINPNTVESISVLKDAAAASIWGVRSGNGVIVIQTKKGVRNQKLSIGFNANLTVGDKPYIDKDPNFLNANEYIDLEQQLFKRGFYDAKINSNTELISPVVQILADERSGKISAGVASQRLEALKTNDIRNDIKKYLYRQSVNQQYAIDLKGGNDKNDYFFSAGYDKNLSSLVGNKNDRISLSALYNYYPLRNLQFTTGINFNQQNLINNSPPLSNPIYPYSGLADENGKPLAIPKDVSDAYKENKLADGFLNWQYKPLDELNYTDNSNLLIDNRINTGLKYTLLPGFSAEIKYQYEKQTNKGGLYNSVDSYYTRDLINRFTQPSGPIRNPIPIGGILRNNNGTLTSHQIRGQVNYDHSWPGDHVISAIAGIEQNQNSLENNYYTTYGYNSGTHSSTSTIDYSPYYALNPSGFQQVPNALGFSQTNDNFRSYFANASYIFKNRYIFSGSGRIDQSNLFGVNTNQKSIPLYSVGFAWNLSNEHFYSSSTLPYLKLRTTFGYNGNINKSVAALTTMTQANGSYFFGQDYARIESIGNPELRWEKLQVINIGIDFGLKDQVLTGSLEYYHKKGIDLFGSAPLAPSTGSSSFFGNVAGIKGNGIDVILNSRNIQSTNFQWTTNFSISRAVEKITSYNQEVASGLTYIINSSASSILPVIGKPLYAIYSYRSAGLTHDTGDPQGYLHNKPSTDYSSILSSTSVDSLLFHGSARPTTYGFFRNTFSYKNLSLSFNLLYKLDYYFRRSTISYSALYAGNAAGHSDYLKRWQNPGDELHTRIPSLQYPPVNSDREAFYSLSEDFVEKGDHIRLQDIRLGYDLTNSLASKLAIKRLNIYGYVNNVAILWKATKTHLDPDAQNGIPIPRTYSIGIRGEF